MSPPRDSEAVATAQRLTEALDNMSGKVDELRETIDADREASQTRDSDLAKYGRLNRVLVIAAIVGFVLDVTATTFAFVAYADVLHAQAQIRDNSATVAQVHQSLVDGCQSGNVIRAFEKQALDAILVLGPRQPGETKKERALAEALLARDRAKVAQGWAPRNCQHVYRLVR